MQPVPLKNDIYISAGKPIANVIDVDYLGDCKLYLEFDDGAYGEVDLQDYIQRIPSMHDLKNPEKFIQFSLSDGTIGWERNRDVSPIWLRENLKPTRLH